MQEKDNITQRINTFLDREEVQKNKYKPREEQVKDPETKSKCQIPTESPQKCPKREKYKSARLECTSRPGGIKILLFVILFHTWICINK